MALRYISPNELLVAEKRQQKEGMQYTILTYAGFRGGGVTSQNRKSGEAYFNVPQHTPFLLAGQQVNDNKPYC